MFRTFNHVSNTPGHSYVLGSYPPPSPGTGEPYTVQNGPIAEEFQPGGDDSFSQTWSQSCIAVHVGKRVGFGDVDVKVMANTR